MMHPFQRMLDAAGVTDFKAVEFWSRASRGAPRAIEPDPCRFERMIPTAILIQKIRTRYGKPLRLSAYRHDVYNRIVGGGKDSEHLQFRAGDLFPVDDFTAEDLARLKRVSKEVCEEAHRDGMRTGLGIYPGFVHVDTGSPKGFRRRWYGT